MLPILQLGPLSIRTPGLALLAGLWIGLEVASRAGLKRGIDADRLYNFGFLVVVAGILAARLGFVLANLGLYTRITPWTRSLGAVFALSPGTEIVWVGLLGAAAVAALLIWRWKLPPALLADSLAPAAAILALSIGLAALLRGDMLGLPATLPWSVPLSGAHRHPTQVYFMLGAVAALVLALRLGRDPSAQPPGALAQWVVAVLCLTVLLVDPLRAGSAVLGPGLRVSSLVALGILIADLALFAARAPARTEAERVGE